MAETIAIVGIVASIVQLVDFSSKVLHRLNDFQSHLDDVPESFRHIKTELPLLLTTLQRTKEALDAGAVDDHTKRALLAVIAGCREQIKSLDDVLIKTLPVTGESWSKKSRKAVSSLYQDSKVEKIATTIRNYVQTLTYYHAAASSKLQPLAGMLFPVSGRFDTANHNLQLMSDSKSCNGCQHPTHFLIIKKRSSST
jgi:hypothetical protein